MPAAVSASLTFEMAWSRASTASRRRGGSIQKRAVMSTPAAPRPVTSASGAGSARTPSVPRRASTMTRRASFMSSPLPMVSGKASRRLSCAVMTVILSTNSVAFGISTRWLS